MLLTPRVLDEIFGMLEIVKNLEHIVTTSDNNVLSTVVDSGLRYLLSIVIGLLIVPTSEYECRRRSVV